MSMDKNQDVKSRVIAGVCAGIVGTVVAFPFDVVKTRMQGHSLSFQQAIQSIRKSGVRTYRGLGTNLVGVGPEKAIALTVNATVLDFFENNNLGSRTTTRNQIAAGAAAGTTKCVVTVPLELLKMKLQINKSIEGVRLTEIYEP